MKTTKLCFIALLVAVIMLSWVGSAAQAWFIRDFSTHLTLRPDSSLSVREEIQADFESESKHGIFRSIPVNYRRGSLAYNLRLKVLAVEDENGRPYSYRVSRQGRYREIRIGDPKRYVSGTHWYIITYLVERGINYFDDHDELYWNTTGDEWPVPIGRAQAMVSLPAGIPPDEIITRSFTGPRGSQESRAEISQELGDILFRVDNLKVREGLTVVVGVPKGYLRRPGLIKIIIWFLADNWFFLVPLVVLILMLAIWMTSGRNPRVEESIMVHYRPPSDLTPSEAGTLVDERADLTDITAMIIDLAVRGYLKIEQLDSKKLLFFSNRDYRFELLKEFTADPELKTHEQQFLTGIFGSGSPGGTVTLSSLKNKFYVHLPKIRNSLYQVLSKQGYFYGRPDRIRGAYRGVGIALAMAGFFLMVILHRWEILVLLSVSGGIVLAFSTIMPRLTARGVRMVNQILGLKEFISRVEEDRLKRMSKEDPTLFDRILPFAMVLGVADEWADAFRDIYREPPGWFVSSHYVAGAFYTGMLVSDLGQATKTMGSTLASAPSQAGKGGSGFGGGGFSGGGFGGGGGGAW